VTGGIRATGRSQHLQLCTIIVRAETKSIVELAGMLKAPKGKRVAIEDMNPWR